MFNPNVRYKDYHMHTAFSFDSEATVVSMIEGAIKKGLTEICITDHYDFNYPGGDDFTMDITQYQKTIQQLALQYKDKITVKCGIEIGLDLNYKTEIHALLATYEFDFVIGSIHVIDDTEFYYGEYFKGKTKEEAHRYYLETVLACLKEFPEIDVLGHIDYIIRYGKDYYPDYQVMEYEKYSDLFQQIFDELITTGRGLDVNTSGYKYGMNCSHPDVNLLKQYTKQGGTYITFGSDAHRPEHIAYGFEEVYEKIKEL